MSNSEMQMRMLRNVAQGKALEPTAAQKEARAVAGEAIHEALRKLSSADTCYVLEAHVKARPDMAAKHLEVLGNHLQRLAWNMERHHG